MFLKALFHDQFMREVSKNVIFIKILRAIFFLPIKISNIYKIIPAGGCEGTFSGPTPKTPTLLYKSSPYETKDACWDAKTASQKKIYAKNIKNIH